MRIRNASARPGPLAKRKSRKHAQRPRLAAFFALSLTGMLAALIVLASQTMVPQITRAPGVVVPLGSYTQIESVHGGVVEAVHVDDGASVSTGRILVELSNSDLQRDMTSLQEERAGLEQQYANARAVLITLDHEGMPSPGTISAIRERGLDQAVARLQIYMESQRIMAATIAQHETTNLIIADALVFAQDRAVRRQASLEQKRELLEKGIMRQSEFQGHEDQADNLTTAASDTAIKLAQETKALLLAKAEKVNETLALRKALIEELAQLEPELARVSAAQKNVRQKLETLIIVAPASGVLQAVAFPSVGEVVEPGETLFELLPARNTLVVEARIPNAEIGHIGTEHEVSITFDSFDARRFGKAQGSLATLSPIPLTDEMTGDQYFRGAIYLEAAHIGEGVHQRPISAGLTVVAEMVTGEQTLLSYFLKPLQRILDYSFSER